MLTIFCLDTLLPYLDASAKPHAAVTCTDRQTVFPHHSVVSLQLYSTFVDIGMKSFRFVDISWKQYFPSQPFEKADRNNFDAEKVYVEPLSKSNNLNALWQIHQMLAFSSWLHIYYWIFKSNTSKDRCWNQLYILSKDLILSYYFWKYMEKMWSQVAKAWGLANSPKCTRVVAFAWRLPYVYFALLNDFSFFVEDDKGMFELLILLSVKFILFY